MTNSAPSSTDAERLDRLNEDLVLEWSNFLARERSSASVGYSKAQRQLAATVRSIGEHGSIETVLSAERAIIENERRLYGNSASMEKSAKLAVLELDSAVIHLELLRAPARYRDAVDRLTQRPRNRRQGLPDDEARQFFRSHRARLRNRDASRLTREEKRTLIERGANMRGAEKAYIQLQRVALGLARPREREGPQSPEMDR